MLLWVIATPLGAAPDEPDHVVTAAAAVRGELVGDRLVPSQRPANTVVHVPATFASLLVVPNCYAFRSHQPAGCAPGITASRTVQPVVTSAGHAPPLYYMLVGLGSYFPGGRRPIYLMRVLSVLLNAAFLALAIATVERWSPSRLGLLGILLAASPMVFFLSSVVNPSGLEITSSIALWTALCVWCTSQLDDPPAGLIGVMAVSATVLVLTRGVSILWPYLFLLIVAPLFAGRSGLRRLLKRRDVLASLVVVGLASVTGFAWLQAQHGLTLNPVNVPSPATSSSTLLGQAIAHMPGYLRESVGSFGWLDTPLPIVLVYAWWSAVCLIALYAFVKADFRARLSLLLLVTAGFGFPVLSVLAVVRKDGFAGQGRYFLPIFVGLPILATCLLGAQERARRPRIAGALVVAGIGLVQFLAFGLTLRRYLVGKTGPLSPTASVRNTWHPPVPSLALDLIGLLLLVSVVSFLVVKTAAQGRPVLRQ
jgi:hypothetical protein